MQYDGKCKQASGKGVSRELCGVDLRQTYNVFDEGDVGMNCYRIVAFVIAVAVMASVFSGCSQDSESTVSTSITTVSDASQTEVTAMPEYIAEYTLSNENADEITQNAASEIESEQEEISMQQYEKIMAELPPEGIFDLQDGVIYPDFQKYTYYSQTAERESRVNVLLPPDYSEDKEYPVLYVLHGYYDNEDWMARDIVGMSKMLSNLYASGEAQEMIVVCPYIFVSKELAWCTGMNLTNSLCYDNFINDLTTDLMPFIESTFSVAKGRENTAITGFSMGGRESLFIGFQLP